MKKIKVYLQYPWKFPDSPYYRYLIQNPPQNVEYLNILNQKGVITNKKIFWFSNFLKRNVRRIANLLNPAIPNAHLSPNKDYDLIHCAHCLSLNKRPWVADFEMAWQFWVSQKVTNRGKESVKKLLLSKYCKKIISWTKQTKEEIETIFPGQKLSKKIEVVYPAVLSQKIRKKSHKGINLLFVGRYFHAKGGLVALKVFDYITKKYENVEAFFISQVPGEILEEYNKNNKIKFFELMPQKELFKKIYQNSDIFVYPGYSDTFGFAIIEAMSFGLPVITVNGTARKEIIENGKEGFVIERPEIIWKKGIPRISNEERLIKKICEKVELLIKNRRVRNNMGKKSRKKVEKGKFSIKERNKNLKKIYEEALK